MLSDQWLWVWLCVRHEGDSNIIASSVSRETDSKMGRNHTQVPQENLAGIPDAGGQQAGGAPGKPLTHDLMMYSPNEGRQVRQGWEECHRRRGSTRKD